MTISTAPARLESRHVLRGRARFEAVLRETVMVVDDEQSVALTTGAMLRELGYDVIVASNVAGAMINIATRDDIDLLVTDIVMPGELSGPDLADYAWRRASIKSLLVSGYSAPADAARDRGLFPVLAKPFRLDDFERQIRAVLDTPWSLASAH